MYKINFNHLHYFLTIAKEGSIVKASKKLNITQPALSLQLKILEEDLDKKLFDRVGRRLVINEDGESVKAYATKIFRHSEEMLSFLKSNSRNTIKIIKIGTVPWISNDQIYLFIKRLLFTPEIRVQVFQEDLDNLLKDLQNDRLDLVLCDSPYAGKSKDLQGHLLGADPIVCVASKKDIIKGSFPKNLKGKKIINYSEACQIGDDIDEFLKSNSLETQTVGEFSDTSLIKVAIEAGGIIGFLPESVIKNSTRGNLLRKLGTLEDAQFSLWAITKKNYKRNGILADLIKKFTKS